MIKTTLSMSIHAFQDKGISNAIEKFMTLGIDKVHFDVMDGKFAPTVSFSVEEYKKITSESDANFDVHLMVSNPEEQVAEYIKFDPELITFHVEALDKNTIIPLINKIKSAGIKAGIAFEVNTHPDEYTAEIEASDFVLFMSVPIGYSGQKFRPEVLDKVKFAEGKEIGIDGGVTIENIDKIKKAGVSYIIMGSLLTRLADAKNDIAKMKEQ